LFIEHKTKVSLDFSLIQICMISCRIRLYFCSKTWSNRVW